MVLGRTVGRGASLAAACLLMAATVVQLGSAAPSGAAAVTIVDFAFQPQSVTVSVGAAVTWTNTGSAPHTATANDGAFDTGLLNAGQSGSHAFNAAGSFAYFCQVHPNMAGTVVVQSRPSPTPSTLPSTGDAPIAGVPVAILVGLAVLLAGGGVLVSIRAGGGR